jgi:hypothetical protein
MKWVLLDGPPAVLVDERDVYMGRLLVGPKLRPNTVPLPRTA